MKPIALYASPECCRSHNLNLHKGYFNVAWFVRAYAPLLAGRTIFATHETLQAVERVEEERVDADLLAIGAVADQEDFLKRWRVPQRESLQAIEWKSLGDGFEAQVRLAALVAKGEVERVLMFQDPDDVHSHLPEAYALIRNCTLANVSLNINTGATLWAESEWDSLKPAPDQTHYGNWRREQGCIWNLLVPSTQEIAFVAHDEEKVRMSRFVYHYRNRLRSVGFKLTGTSGTCRHAVSHLETKDTPHCEMLDIHAKGAADGSGHGPTGGDVVIADEIIREWTRQEEDQNGKPGRTTMLKKLEGHLNDKFAGETADEAQIADLPPWFVPGAVLVMRPGLEGEAEPSPEGLAA